MEFLAIPIMINGNVQYFDFRCSDVYVNGHFCHVTSMGHQIIFNQDHTIENTDMPVAWIKSVSDKLDELLNRENFNNH